MTMAMALLENHNGDANHMAYDPNKTLGQVAYEADVHHSRTTTHIKRMFLDWAQLPEDQQVRWEAVANAVAEDIYESNDIPGEDA